MSDNELKDCPDCEAKPGEVHEDYCDVEMCSVCGDQQLGCECKGHDKGFARWTGFFPGKAEARFLGLDYNRFYTKYREIFFVKPKSVEEIKTKTFVVSMTRKGSEFIQAEKVEALTPEEALLKATGDWEQEGMFEELVVRFSSCGVFGRGEEVLNLREKSLEGLTNYYEMLNFIVNVLEV